MGWKDLGNLMLELSRGAGAKMSPVSAPCPKLPRARCWFGRETGVKFSNSPTTGIFLETSEKSNSWNYHEGNVWWALRCFFNPNAKWSRWGNAMKRKMRVARAAGYRGGRGLGGWVGSFTFGSWMFARIQGAWYEQNTKTLKHFFGMNLYQVNVSFLSSRLADTKAQSLNQMPVSLRDVVAVLHCPKILVFQGFSLFTIISAGHNMCYFTFKINLLLTPI